MKEIFKENNNNLVFYESKDGGLSLQVQLENESVWLSQKQMAELFDKNRRTITEHIGNIFKEEELEKDSVCRNFQHTASDGKKYTTQYYDLDVIISVGYRVKSKRGTQFRQWATKLLKDYLIEGYALNETLLKKQNNKIKQLESTLSIMSDLMQSTELGADESQGLLVVIREYTHALNLLDSYDHQVLELPQTRQDIKFDITYAEARNAVDQLSRQFRAQGENMGLFGQERGDMFKSCLESVYQTFDETDLYPSIEEKAAHLLYFLIKNHPFSDGNKRIGAFLFIWFLERNELLYFKNGTKRIEDNALVAICLMVAQSNPKEKDIMTLLIVNLITKNENISS